MKNLILFLCAVIICIGCKEKLPKQVYLTPTKVFDLGTVVTEDLPEKVWGKTALTSMGFNKSNQFEVVDWKFETEAGKITGSNSYFTLFNHGGPHIDAPSHMDLGGGLDTYPIEVFSGPLKVFDVSHLSHGHTVPMSIFKDKVNVGDIILIYTKYLPPQTDEGMPENITLSPEAAEYLAAIPVKAFGTDAWSVMSFNDTVRVESESEAARLSPIHYSFLSRKIPIYEGLCQLDSLLLYQNMYFVGVPLNIKDGDGMLVRPVAFVYQY